MMFDNYLEIRAQINSICMDTEATTIEVFSIQEFRLRSNTNEFPVRVYHPHNQTILPVILMIHGGAWVAGNLDTHDNLARYIAKNVGAVVVSVGYTNSPEAKFPLALEQCYESLRWICNNQTQLKIDERIGILGDSAGGNLAAALCLMNHDLDQIPMKALVLINPALDLSLENCGQNRFLNWQVQMYLDNLTDASSPYVSPLLAENFSGFPKTLITVAELDEQRDDGERFAVKLQQAGIPTQLFCQKGIGHLGGHAARASKRAEETLVVCSKAFQDAF